MQLTGGIKLTKRHWLMLDLLAILFVAGTVTGIIAVWSGAWWPFETLLLPEWPFLAFFAWFLAISTALVVFGSHLQWSDMQRAASSTYEAKPVAAPPIAAQPAPSAVGTGNLCLDLVEAPVEVDLEDDGAEVEPVLAAAGR